eukprot:6490572-Amphidinium_carterae.1
MLGPGSPSFDPQVVDEVALHAAEYTPFFADFNVEGWLAAMRLDKAWGDNHSLKAALEVLRRPAIVWRLGAPPTEPPTPLLPSCWPHLDEVRPLYIILDERHRRCEHYDALVPTLVTSTRHSTSQSTTSATTSSTTDETVEVKEEKPMLKQEQTLIMKRLVANKLQSKMSGSSTRQTKQPEMKVCKAEQSKPKHAEQGGTSRVSRANKSKQSK